MSSSPPLRALTGKTLQHATRVLCAQDADLRAIVRRFGPPPLWARRPGYATLVRIILEQQVSLASAQAMFRKLRQQVHGVTPGTVAGLGVPGLRRLGFTRQKAAYCASLATRLQTGGLDLSAVARANTEAARRTLLQIHGLGPWSVDIYLLMALRRPDIWPHGDLALADAVFRVKRLRAHPLPEVLARFAARWTPWRSVAARLLWHYYLSTGRSLPTPRTRQAALRVAPERRFRLNLPSSDL